MPTYDYECERGHRFEVFQSMKDEPLAACVECGAPARRRIGPGAGFLFRGDGFYSTDYRSQTYKDKAKAESGGSAGAADTSKKSGDAAASGGSGGTQEAAKPAADKPPPKPSST